MAKPKKLDQKAIELISQIVDDDDPGPSRSVLGVFIRGLKNGHRLDILLEDMAKEATKELEG
jgi:hypothetical protein